MLTIKDLSYAHPNKGILFQNINLTLGNKKKMALVGVNGIGKSTLLKIIAGELQPLRGKVFVETKPYLVPQVFGQFNNSTVAQALKIDRKINAYFEILKGDVSEENYRLLNDDWTIEDRVKEAFQNWELSGIGLTQKLKTLSGGQKTKVFLAGIDIHNPDFVLLDEPSNHLDFSGREVLYDFVHSAHLSIITVSHDRKLLNNLNRMAELHFSEIKLYGGNFKFYIAQKRIEANALLQDIQNKEKSLKNVRDKEQETKEKQQKLDIRAKKNLNRAGLPKIVANTWKNNAEKSTSKVKGIHAKKVSKINNELRELRSSLTQTDKMKFDFDNSALHKGKILFSAENINFKYNNHHFLWDKTLTFKILSGERVQIKGKNGSGKTTLVNIILGNLIPQNGKLYIAKNRSIYIDQDYSLINNGLSIYGQAKKFNINTLQEHEVKTRLVRFLFPQDDWNKPCATLSGGERMRLLLCCLNISNKSPDLIILDEPTNNLDIQNIGILTNVIKEYQGTLIVISHDETFIKEININRTFNL